MQLKQLLTEERAVSPVIGVILMVAITVILAAVIGTFVLGLGQNVNSTPSASFGFDFAEDSSGYNVTITHEGGDSLSSDNSQNITVTSTEFGTTEGWLDDDGPIQAGDTYTYGEASGVSESGSDGNQYAGSTNQLSSGETVRVVFVGSEGNSATLASQDVPS